MTTRTPRIWRDREPGLGGLHWDATYVVPNDVEVPPGRREIDSAEVERLAASIKTLGLLSRPIVRQTPSDDDSFILVAGAHRLEALKRLGCGDQLIEMWVCPDHATAEEIELVEIDENLVRVDLKPAERAKANARRKELFDLAAVRELERTEQHDKERAAWRQKRAKLDAQAARREERRNEVRTADASQTGARGGARPQKKGYIEAAMSATGQSRRAIEKDVARAAVLGTETLNRVAADIPDHKVADLDALASVESDKRGEAIDAVKRGDAMTVRDAVRVLSAPPPENPVNPPTVLDADRALAFQVKRLQGHWTSFRSSFQHMPAAARVGWWEQHGADVIRTLGQNEVTSILSQLHQLESA